LKHPIRCTTEAVCRSEKRGEQTGQCLTDSDVWGNRRGWCDPSWFFRTSQERSKSFIKMGDHEKSKSANIVKLI